MKVVIVEDEPLAVDRLEELILRYDNDIEITGKFDSIEEVVEFFQENPEVDLTFMDIQLSDGLSFDIFRKINIRHPVIFTTAFDQYAVKAFKVNSVDYLLKPIDYDELRQAIEKFKNLHNRNQSPIDLAVLNEIIQNLHHSYKKRFVVRIGDRIQFKAVNEISYIFADGKAVSLVQKNTGHRFLLDHTIQELESSLLNPAEFFRINRKIIIRLDSIQDVRPYINSRLIIRTGQPSHHDLVVSRDRVGLFKEWLNQ